MDPRAEHRQGRPDPRRARLFELIRQGTLARHVTDQIEAAEPAPVEAMEAVRRAALASLRPRPTSRRSHPSP